MKERCKYSVMKISKKDYFDNFKEHNYVRQHVYKLLGRLINLLRILKIKWV